MGNNGNLERGGAYDRSCNSCSFSGTSLKCSCKRRNGNRHTTTTDLDRFMTNNNGKFKNCGSATSSPVPKTAEENVVTIELELHQDHLLVLPTIPILLL